MTQVILWCSVLLPTMIFFFYSSRKMLQNLAQIFKHFFELQVQYFHLKLNWMAISGFNQLHRYGQRAPSPTKLGIQLSSTVISDKQKSAQLISLEKPLAVLWWSACRTACGKWHNSAWKHVACLLKIVHSFSSAYPSCHRAKDEVHPGVVDRLLQERHAHIHSYGQLRIPN